MRPLIEIADISYVLPDRSETNADLQKQNPSWDMDRVEAKTGVYSRRIAADGETALDLAVRACERILEVNQGLRDLVDGIIFCTQTGDYIMPPNSCVLHGKLGLREQVFAMDTNLACSGYVYGLAVAEGLISTGVCHHMLLVTSDTYSKLIHPGDRSARSLFGDGAAVTWLRRSQQKTGLLDILCETSGAGYLKFYVPDGGMRCPLTEASRAESVDSSGNLRSASNIHMDGMGVLGFVSSRVPRQVRTLLERNGLTIGDIDLMVAHQASQFALDSLTRLLKLPADRVFRNLKDIGNTVSASIPMALAEAQASGRAKPNDLVLLTGFGVGLSWASALVRL